jgi:molybdopterin converting factor small subunit
MVVVRLLGGARKAIGRDYVTFEAEQTSVSELVSFLQNVSAEPRLIQRDNLLIAINGIESSALQGTDTIIKNNDSVTIVTVVHGG